eukprot:scaffold6931_cov443-Prasinococcus_capsulatus_cf.AAC.7
MEEPTNIEDDEVTDRETQKDQPGAPQQSRPQEGATTEEDLSGEPVLVGDTLVRLPEEVFNVRVVDSALSYDAWQQLDEESKSQLYRYLPDLDDEEEEEREEIVRKLLTGRISCFGDPADDFKYRLIKGQFHPSIVQQQRCLSLMLERANFQLLREHHDNYVYQLLCMQELFDEMPDTSTIQEQLSMWRSYVKWKEDVQGPWESSILRDLMCVFTDDGYHHKVEDRLAIEWNEVREASWTCRDCMDDAPILFAIAFTFLRQEEARPLTTEDVLRSIRGIPGVIAAVQTRVGKGLYEVCPTWGLVHLQVAVRCSYGAAKRAPACRADGCKRVAVLATVA